MSLRINYFFLLAIKIAERRQIAVAGGVKDDNSQKDFFSRFVCAKQSAKMENGEIYIVKTRGRDQARQIRAVLKALKIKFEVTNENSPYDPAMITKIRKSKLQYKSGKYTRVSKKGLQKFLEKL